MPAQTLVFDLAQVPCHADAIAAIYARLEGTADLLAQRGGDPGVLRRALAGRPGDATDGNDAHRHLLAARRAARLDDPFFQEYLNSAVKQASWHSTLYGPRTCTCATDAWFAFRTALSQALASVTRPARSWAVTLDGTPARDLTRVEHDTLTALLNRAAAAQRGAVVPFKHLAVRVDQSGVGEPVVTATSGTGRSAPTVTLAALTPTAARLSSRMPDRSGATILTWPQDLVELLDALSGSWSRARLRDGATWLLSGPFDQVTPDARSAAARLARGWTGTLAELLEAAAVIAAA